MSNSQNKKNNLCTTLTEQWKKGELPCGWYYVYLKHLEMFEIAGSSTLSGILERGNEDGIEVLALVPSYQENAKLKELLHSLKCCLTSENIEPQIRIDKSLGKIDNAIGE